MNILDAVHAVLKEAKKPLKASELVAEITARGLWQAGGGTPNESVGASLYEDIKKKGAHSRFAKVGHGYFALATDAKRSKKSNSGFVYILTHPCFKENIVKIGRTQGAVEDRSKQLFTTALPKPFDIYATMETSKFTQAEELIHLMFQNERISPNREFFNISPKRALEIFYKVRGLLEDGKITEDYKTERVFDEDNKADAKSGKELTARQKTILAFWTAFNKYAESNVAFKREFALRKPGKYSYYDFGINRGTYHVFMRVTSLKGTILVGLYVSKDKQTYENFIARREEIEKFVGGKLEWRWAKLDGAFSLVKQFDIKCPPSEWTAAFKWLCETAIKFKRVDEKFGLKR